MQWRAVALCVMATAIGVSAGSPVGTILGKKVYWESTHPAFDTLGWGEIERSVLQSDSSRARGPHGALGYFAEHERKIFQVKNPTAMNLAILADLGYEPVVLTNWFARPIDQISIDGGPDYERRRIVSDYLWERVSDVDISRGAMDESRYELTFHFDEGGWSRYPGRKRVCSCDQQVVTPGKGVEITFANLGGEALVFDRRILAVYIVAEERKRVSRIVSDIEAIMDKLELDMSYKPAELVELTEE